MGESQETYGEDPYLTAQLGVNVVKGLQGMTKNILKFMHVQNILQYTLDQSGIDISLMQTQQNVTYGQLIFLLLKL